MVKRRSLSSWAFFLLGIFTIIALVAGPPIAAYAVAAPSTTTTSCGISCSPSPSGAVVEQQQEDDIISSGEHHHHNNNLDKFYIHGWRWHTLSLGRDARRLAQLATHYHHHTFALLQKKQQEQEEEGVTTTNVFADLQKATDHTVNFNMKGLHQIEQEVFFPWVRRVVVESILLSMKNNKNKNEKSAVATTTQQQQQQQRRLVATMDRLEQYQRRLHELGRALVTQSILLSGDSSSSSPSPSSPARRGPTTTAAATATKILASLSTMIELATEMAETVQSMRQEEETVIVPLIAQYVSSTDQTTLNNNVIRKLGIFDSRIHLVSMYESIVAECPDELELFQRSIPSIPRRLIPRWKRLLYDPRVGGLHNDNNDSFAVPQ